MILELKDVRKKRGEDYTLRIDNLAVERGEPLAILGPSGCGKSTTLDIIGLVLNMDSAGGFRFAPENETVDVPSLWQGNNSSALAELRRKNIGYVLQTGEIFNFINVVSNVQLTALAAGLSAQKAQDRAMSLLDTLEIAHLANAMPAALSIGQRQRVAIARALAHSPALLLADEPTSALDPVLARKVMKLLLEASTNSGTSLLLVSHDHQLVSEFGFKTAEIAIHGNEAVLDGTL